MDIGLIGVAAVFVAVAARRLLRVFASSRGAQAGMVPPAPTPGDRGTVCLPAEGLDALGPLRGSRPRSGAMRRALGLLCVAAVTVLGSACGGVGGSEENAAKGGEGTTVMIDYVTLAEEKSTGGATIGGPVRSLGDKDTGEGIRIILEFRFDELPANATITEAHLHVTFLSIIGEPFGKLGDMQVVRIATTGTIGGVFDAPVLAHDMTSDLATLSTPSRPAIDVTTVVQSSYAASDEKVRMRVQFPTATSGDMMADTVSIATKIGSPPPPVLEIKYTTP
jgi:hypothetical protein